MAADRLSEIDGHKPKVLLRDGETREVKPSNSHGYTYKIKRSNDLYYCHCPAWRNQTGVPVNARTCKHLKTVLGDEYETARIDLNNPNSKSSSSKGKRKRNDDDDEDEDEEEEEDIEESEFNQASEDEDDEPPQKKRKPVSKSSKPIPKGKGKKKAPDSDNESESDAPRKKKTVSKGKGKKKAVDSDEEPDSDAPRKKKSVYRGNAKKKAADSDDDSAPEPPQKRKPISLTKGKAKVAQSSKRASKKDDSDDGEDFSDEINAVEGSDSEEEKPKKKAKANASPKKPATKKKTKGSDDEADSEEEATSKKRKKPASTSAKKPPAKKAKVKPDSDDDVTAEDSADDLLPNPKKNAGGRAPVSKGKGKKTPKVESDAEEDDEDEDAKPQKKSAKPKSKAKKEESDAEDDDEDDKKASPASGPSSSSSDPLAEISGKKPKVLLADGEERMVKSMSSNSEYKVKRTWDHYYCQCPAWRNQAGAPTNARTCKHLRQLLGDAYETARLMWQNPNGPVPKPASKPKSKSKKKKAGDDDDDDDDNGGGGKSVPELLLANKWDIDTGPDPTGWWISEKLDGVRTFYDGKGMVSRLGNPFTPPQWFLDKLPKDCTLDGELFGGRGNFQDTVSIVKTMNSPHWKNITFQIFDVPSEKTAFEDRVKFLQKLFGPGGKYECDEVVLVEHEKAKNRKHVLDKLKEIEELGGEGLMLRKAGSKYEGRRSSTLLKIKTFYDAEAEVTGYTDGKGKHAGLTGALKCKMASGKTFNVGTGLSDKQRRNPPKIGSIITYRFQELTRDGVPRFPSYIGEAIDKKKAKDAKLPAHRKAGGSKDD
ncbi:Dna ligase [Favolaschia claudopus]|uniref:Dna ligase n=1 Tax=Favolaschia claudopus TaxID=2862362 RepID=A0AAW0DKV5_9AGAR